MSCLCRSLILTYESTTDLGIWDLQQDSKATPSIPGCSIRAAAPTLEEVTGTSTEPSDRDRNKVLRCVTCHSMAGSESGLSSSLGTLIAVGSCPGVYEAFSFHDIKLPHMRLSANGGHSAQDEDSYDELLPCGQQVGDNAYRDNQGWSLVGSKSPKVQKSRSWWRARPTVPQHCSLDSLELCGCGGTVLQMIVLAFA